jgi:RNA polymerase sigma-70 factor (ECF subfamily)
MSTADDYELLRRWNEGDKRAGDELVTRHYRRIGNFFASSVQGVERLDLTQETFARLVKAKQGFEGRSSFLGFLFGIARNVLNEFLRTRYGKGNFDPLTQSLEDLGGLSPSRALSQIARHQALLEAMRKLPVETMQLLDLFYWQGMTAGVLAEIFDIPEPTVRSRIHAARQRLMTSLEQGNRGMTEDDLDTCVREIAALYDKGPAGLGDG